MPQSWVLFCKIWFNISTGNLRELRIINECKEIAAIESLNLNKSGTNHTKNQKTAHQYCNLKWGRDKQSAGVPSPVQQEPKKVVSGREYILLSGLRVFPKFKTEQQNNPR